MSTKWGFKWKWAVWAAACAALAFAFMLYTRPAVMVQVADLVWACFR